MTADDSRGAPLDGARGTLSADERAGDPGDMSDDVARLVRLAGTSGPIAAERLARVRTAVYGAWSDEYVAHKVKTRRRLTVAVLFAAAASVVIAVAIWGSNRTPAPVLVARIDHFTEQATESPGPSSSLRTLVHGGVLPRGRR